MRTMAAEQARLEGEVVQREKRLAEVRQASSLLPSLQAELRKVHDGGAAIGEVEKQHEELRAVVGRAREDAGEKRTVNTQLKKEMFEIRAQIDELEKLSTCPTCRRAVDAHHKQRLHAEYAAQGTRLRDDFRTHEAAYRELDAAVVRDEAVLAEAARALQDREGTHRRLVQAENLVAQAQEAQRQLGELRVELVERQRLLKENLFATSERKRLASIERQIAMLAYDTKRHVARRSRAAEHAGFDRERERLPHA